MIFDTARMYCKRLCKTVARKQFRFRRVASTPNQQRHNVRSRGSSRGDYRKYLDPPLTNFVAQRADALGILVRREILRRTCGRQLFVLSSSMVRAMETALHNFPGWPVHPIPWVSEGSPSLENTVTSFRQ